MLFILGDLIRDVFACQATSLILHSYQSRSLGRTYLALKHSYLPQTKTWQGPFHFTFRWLGRGSRALLEGLSSKLSAKPLGLGQTCRFLWVIFVGATSFGEGPQSPLEVATEASGNLLNELQ